MRRVLVANRGEIARRVFATCRRLGLGTAAVFTEPDAAAPFVGEADVAVALGAPGAYLDAAAVVAAAHRAGADAVHPGYGFLAENAGFARAVLDAGLTWIGPSPEAIAAMGSKTVARARMGAAGVPVLPGADDPREADAVGFPLLVKARAGGGGKGMRLVERPEDLDEAVAAARREAGAAFGDDTVFLERFAPRARHVEVQLLGDAHGRVVAVHERDCSVQRRHQKVVEEAPSPAVDAALRARLAAAAVAAGEAIGYVGAGTVEFLLDAGGAFWFLEVNTRLQVEHPVTELVTGLDLVEQQLRIAAGEPVPAVPPLDGHAIEARLYAEDPAAGFLPVTGTLARFAIPAGPGIRVDAGVRDGTVVPAHYDPLLAKVLAHGRTRADAARRLADALARAELHGTTTNRDLLVNILRHPEFLAGAADTGFLERHPCTEPLVGPDGVRLAAAAAALAHQAGRRASARALATLPSGWRNNPSQAQVARFEDGPEVRYRFDRHGRALTELSVDGEPLPAPRLHACTPDAVDLEVGGVRRTYRVAADAVNTPEGQVDLRPAPRFADPTAAAAAAGSLTSPMPGTVVRVAVAAGATVEAGALLLVLEAMKMEHEVRAPAAGTVAELRVQAGSQVRTGAVLAVLGDG